MDSWTLEKAKNHFSEVVRRALAHAPQEVTRGRSGDAVVVVSREDWERRSVATDLVEFMERSPLAAALASGELDATAFDTLFERSPDAGRDVDL
jgi:prevent-host-death family protein